MPSRALIAPGIAAPTQGWSRREDPRAYPDGRCSCNRVNSGTSRRARFGALPLGVSGRVSFRCVLR
jgi:hypothetical protein